MFGIPWSYIGIFLALVGVIATGYFAVQHYNSVVAENEKLKIESASLKAEKEQLQHDYENIGKTVDANANMERQVTEKTNTIIREIYDAPVTNNCAAAPSIGIALKHLGEQQK